MITQFRVLGTAEYRRAFDQAAEANRKLAREEKKRDKDTPVSAQAAGFAAVATRAQAMAAAFARAAGALAALGGVVAVSTRAFAQQEQAVFRMQLVLRNLGRAAEIPTLDAFNRQMASMSGQTTTALSALTALLTQFSLTEAEIKRATPVLIDWSQATGIDLPRAADILGSALRGERDAIQRYGVDVDLAADRAGRLDQALAQLQARFRGGAAGQQDTLLGSLTRLQNAWTELGATLGRLFGPLLTGALKAASTVIEGWTIGIKEVLGLLERIGAIRPVGQAAAGVGGGGGADAAAIGGGGGGRAETHLANIDRNTAKVASDIGPLTKQILGGGPSINAAFNFRGLNAALRAAR